MKHGSPEPLAGIANGVLHSWLSSCQTEEYTLCQNKSCCEGLSIFAQQLFNSKNTVDLYGDGFWQLAASASTYPKTLQIGWRRKL
jgi:hypothetical protein